MIFLNNIQRMFGAKIDDFLKITVNFVKNMF